MSGFDVELMALVNSPFMYKARTRIMRTSRHSNQPQVAYIKGGCSLQSIEMIEISSMDLLWCESIADDWKLT